jgi:hypothetical protein
VYSAGARYQPELTVNCGIGGIRGCGCGECTVGAERVVMGGGYVQDFPSVLCAGLVHDPAETAPQHIARYSLIAVTTIIALLAAWYELNR